MDIFQCWNSLGLAKVQQYISLCQTIIKDFCHGKRYIQHYSIFKITFDRILGDLCVPSKISQSFL